MPIPQSLARQLIEAWAVLPEGIRSEPASDQELIALENEMGPIPPDFRWFLQKLGGGPVGSEWIDNANELRESHAKFKAESVAPSGWTLTDCFVVGWDGSGNPLAIDNTTGALVVEDHEFGGIHPVAPSFLDFLRKGLLEGSD